ncbi:hypothetical protein S7711_08782 [Stachybotrys chartarum IBT 7711]|uniref:Phosphoribosylaminoimidazole-succinocarboxamide synthase n=1 Tax=Stachybotrys chartarum (strain CBS 109288 / IBT 7711) TaxID=1280523 RepID=A0A084AIW6_STACB|nr:hypothetical protein S7711_08782 [Stachybotrys chartarum IBT 7711]
MNHHNPPSANGHVDARVPRSSHTSLQHTPPSDSQTTIRPQRNSREDSVSPQPTVVPPAPSPPWQSSNSSSDIYGPQRLFDQRLTPPSAAYDFGRSAPNPVVRFDEAQLAMFAMDNAARIMSIKDELAIAAGRVTPGVDDTPYIQYALDALTRGRRDSFVTHFPSGSTDDYTTDPLPPRRMAGEEMGYPVVAAPALTHFNNEPKPRESVVAQPVAQPTAEPEKAPEPQEPDAPASRTRNSGPRTSIPDRWGAVTDQMRHDLDPRDKNYPRLTYKPRMLRPFSMLILMTMCGLMLAALIFSAVYSNLDAGLVEYPGTMYSARYFVFRILPQLLAVVILVYAQAIVTASFRTLPFTIMAREDPRERRMALFRSLYPKSFLWPQLLGPWQFKVFSIATWLALFTVPLQSAAFTCIIVDEQWIWAASQGIIWTLIFLYVFLLVSTGNLMVYWFGQWTGLLWDVRSIGDLLPLLNRSNAMGSYRHTYEAEHDRQLKSQLHDRWFDRLGYWHSENAQTQGVWYAIGTSAVGFDKESRGFHGATAQRASYDRSSLESQDYPAKDYMGQNGFKYLPWHLQDGPVFSFVGVAGVLLLALLIVCFLPETRVEDGFDPLLSARPGSTAFSAANFLYSFLPSLLGMVLFIAFQSMDQALRILQPWAELRKPDGSVAHKSIMLDYAAALPFQCTFKAVRNGHWRVAIMSLMSVLFAFIPILAGGLFMALTGENGEVLMYPSMPVLGVLLALLVFYVACLALMIPGRSHLRLPHPVNTIAGIIDLCAAEDLTQDAAFRAVRSRQDLEGRLGLGRDDPRDETVWYFGVVPGRDENLLSVRRCKKFTERRPHRPRSSMV